MNIELKQEFGARFKLVARNAKTDEITKETEWFLNEVLDTGLNRMSVGVWFNTCCVGSGNSTPNPSQVSLDNFIASTTLQQDGTGGVQTTTSPVYWWYRITWRFGEGVAAGNISEVGVGWSDTGLWNRALIKDINGNPTTITVLSDEYLDVISEIRVYPTESFSGSFNLLDKTGAVISSHTYTGKPYIATTTNGAGRIVLAGTNSGVYVYSGAMGSTVTQGPSTAVTNGGVDTPTNTYPTARSVRIVPSWGLGNGNGSHRSFLIALWNTMFSLNCGYQLEISPPITKTSSQIMTYTFEMTWDRYTP